MISDGKSYPTVEAVFEDLGEKAVAAFSLAVDRARSDLQLYRAAHPQWVLDHSERGLANWISDRLWAQLRDLAGDVPGMDLHESGVLREITIGINYKLRVKRHDDDGSVASYPTQLFLEFVEQPSSQLPGMEETRLIAGYDWDRTLRAIGPAVISLRDGKDNVIWKESLPAVAGGEAAGAPVITPEQPPTPPTIELVAEPPSTEAAEDE